MMVRGLHTCVALLVAGTLGCNESLGLAGEATQKGEDASMDAAPAPVEDGGIWDASSDATLDTLVETDALTPPDASEPCPVGMVNIGAYCIDRYEAYVVEVDDAGVEHPHSPYDVIAGQSVRAKVASGVAPQAYISQIEASKACEAAGKRLCTKDEFQRACRGDDAGAYYPYGGTVRKVGMCNEGKGSSMPRFFGSDAMLWTYAQFNDPRLNQWDGGLGKTGEYSRCVSPYGVYDCVGNLHEWGADPADTTGRGRFRGGFYGDAQLNGPGCLYVTSAHELAYHDYSTGFRCCASARPLP